MKYLDETIINESIKDKSSSIKDILKNYNEPIYIIGLPGSGKSMLGKMLSDILSFKFVDLDEFIVQSSGMEISEIFKIGESEFRRVEKESLISNSKSANTIVSTGGGVVVTPDNRSLLIKSKFVIYINRSYEDILNDVNLSDRPLLKDNPNRIFELFNERKKFYKDCSTLEIINDSSIELLLEKTIDKLYKILNSEV